MYQKIVFSYKRDYENLQRVINLIVSSSLMKKSLDIHIEESVNNVCVCRMKTR